MSAKMKEYRYYLSSGVNTSVRVKISMLELAPGAAVSLAGDLLVPPPAPSSSRASSPPVSSASTLSSSRAPATSTAPLRAFSAPMLTQRCVASPSELRNATISEIFVTAQVFADGVPLHPMAISSKGPTKCSESTIYWNEWLTLPVRYRDLSRNAQLVLSVWGVGWQPIGGTTLRLFSTPGVLRDGMQCLRVWRDVAADSAPWTTTPGEMDDDWTNRECFRLDKLREKYERKEMARNEWMDGVTDRRIARIRRGSEPPGRRDPLGPFCSYRQDAVMWIELPYFGDVVVYEEEPYAQRNHSAITAASVMAQEMTPKRAPGSSSGMSANAPSSLPSFVGTDGYGYETPSATSSSSSSLVVVWDPDLHEDNPAERKYRKLARDILRGSIDPNLKPSRDEKARIEELLAMPTDSLRNEDKDLLWKFRYTLTDNKKAVVKFLLSVDWNDETEVKQATDLLHQWCEIDIADALKLLGRDKEFKHEVVRNFAVSTLAKAKNEDLLDFLLQLVQALRYEKMTTSSARAGAGAGGSANGVSSSRGGAGAAANNAADDTGSTDGPLTNESFGPLARFLISRCSNDFQMANYFYWYLKVEASDFGRDADMFLAVLNQMCEEMKHDPERRPNYDMLMSQQELMQKILQFHNKAREEKGRKDQKEEKFKQLLKGFPWPRGSVIRMPLDPTIHLSGIVPSSVKMFKSAMYPAVLQFQTVLPHEPPPLNQQQHMSHTSRSSMANGSILDTSGTGSSMMSSSGMLSRASQAGVDEKSLLRETLSTRVIHYLNREREGPMVKIMVKNGDDLRQDQLIMQMFILMDRLLKKVNLDLKLTPYRILATGTTDGLMEFVQDSVPVSYIVANFESPQILSFLRSHHPDPNGPYRVSAEALSNYVKSVAGYCVLTYILGIGDRHLDNLMMKTAGHLFHIDFGFIFGADPKPYPPPFKLTKEMVEGMGGPESEHYLKFKTYCCQAYNWLRKSADLILNLLSLMADGGIEMLSNDPETTLQKVQEKFRLDLTDEQAEQFFLGLINDSVTALFPVLVEYIHKWATKLK